MLPVRPAAQMLTGPHLPLEGSQLKPVTAFHDELLDPHVIADQPSPPYRRGSRGPSAAPPSRNGCPSDNEETTQAV